MVDYDSYSGSEQAGNVICKSAGGSLRNDRIQNPVSLTCATFVSECEHWYRGQGFRVYEL